MHNPNDRPFQNDEPQQNDRPSNSIINLPGESIQAVAEGLSYVPAEEIGKGIVHGLEASGELATALVEVLAAVLEGSGELAIGVVEAIGGVLGGLLSGL